MTSKGRVIDDYVERSYGRGECSDCGAEFGVTIYQGDTQGTAFVRDHPQNGCHVKELRTINTKRTD